MKNIQHSTCFGEKIIKPMGMPPHPDLLPRGGEGIQRALSGMQDGRNDVFYKAHSTFNFQCPSPVQVRAHGMLAVPQFILMLAIRGYQLTLSPLLGMLTGPTGGCRYTPTCSVYAMEALREHGAMAGSVLAAKRICRCHPWGGCGHDPVPRGNAECGMRSAECSQSAARGQSPAHELSKPLLPEARCELGQLALHSKARFSPQEQCSDAHRLEANI